MRQRKRHVNFRSLLCFLLFLPAAVTAADSEEIAPGLKVGDVLDETNWQLAKDLLPPEVLKHYERGEYRNRIVSYPTGKARWEKSFLEATERNATTLDLTDKNTIVDKKTGEQPDFYYGVPFPNIDENDPRAGAKAVWNQFLVYWYGGSSYNRTLVVMLGPERPEREVVANGWFHFYDGQAPKYRTENPHSLQSQFLAVSLKPADLQGTASLTWRYRDPDKRDSVWAFVPALRRVRAVSPANRSDGYIGSDISGDDGFFFDGKPEDFEFKLVAKREGLTLVDPTSVSTVLKTVPVPGGGWWALTDDNPDTVGYLTKGWTGISWAPSGPALAKRSFWVVEVVPRDKYYLYGRMELWIDAETWNGAWNRKFSWQGDLVQNYQVMARVNHPAGSPQDQEWIPLNTMVYACAENFKMNRATLGGMRPDPDAPFHRRMPVDTRLFDPMSLTRYGK